MSERKAVVTNEGQTYSMYDTFASRHGFPKAAAEFGRDRRPGLRNGEKVTVLATGKHDNGYETLHIVEARDGSQYVIGDMGVKLLPAGDIDRLIADIAKLASMCVKLEKRITDLERRLSDHAAAPPKLTRQDVIRRAKADVEHLPTQVHDDVPIACEPYVVATFVPAEDRVRYIVNRDKRTVVALLELGKTVWGRGIAKCAPDDDFDVNIGKAIALRRALGLPVPDEYLNAPQEVSAE